MDRPKSLPINGRINHHGFPSPTAELLSENHPPVSRGGKTEGVCAFSRLRASWRKIRPGTAVSKIWWPATRILKTSLESVKEDLHFLTAQIYRKLINQRELLSYFGCQCAVHRSEVAVPRPKGSLNWDLRIAKREALSACRERPVSFGHDGYDWPLQFAFRMRTPVA